MRWFGWSMSNLNTRITVLEGLLVWNIAPQAINLKPLTLSYSVPTSSCAFCISFSITQCIKFNNFRLSASGLIVKHLNSIPWSHPSDIHKKFELKFLLLLIFSFFKNIFIKICTPDVAGGFRTSISAKYVRNI